METVYKDGVGYTTAEEADNLEEYEVSEAELKRGEWRLLSEVQEN